MSILLKVLSGYALFVAALGFVPAAFAVDALPDARFVGFVQEANNFAIASGRLAQERASSEAVRGFGNRLMIERPKAAQRLEKARSEAGVSYAPTPGGKEPRHNSVLRHLGALQGAEFDAAYGSSQLAALTELVEQVGAYSQNGGSGPLRRFAQEWLPLLEKELDGAKRIAGQ